MAWVYLGLGSNRRRTHHINAGLRALHGRFASAQTPLRVARVFESAAVGFDGHDFYNTVVELQTDLSIAELVETCKTIERDHGHPSSAPKYSPRTLDIDVLLYDDKVCTTPVCLPRGEITENAFVLWPLAELIPEKKHPQTGLSFAQHWQSYRSEQQIKPLKFAFETLPHMQTL
ncbi:2-amino-4-hydroxy-6-hydroxymethyldihydropteridine diphosphokinase [Pseudidiomarina insulisalsae]|uniref:2-amino-4-hydroxy-6-hydroxymethyldihydropteridine diphosphokinase n=1 Tax=Pseudidiomarina insulisalsae TaxID=575789 RepID=A0A432YHR9_9GAMM|nr:2-amino-4-hydroxy-6-hydroxymethyldihydropteridine diphosphokinase [Pseudidiomarina insulisalsae]RUO60499.1 2-amino-4-hydroxy-6-hydroxymethyldihydropteridine diphosphokinase [Pseudidiomarina insulisalsae]